MPCDLRCFLRILLAPNDVLHTWHLECKLSFIHNSAFPLSCWPSYLYLSGLWTLFTCRTIPWWVLAVASHPSYLHLMTSSECALKTCLCSSCFCLYKEIKSWVIEVPPTWDLLCVRPTCYNGTEFTKCGLSSDPLTCNIWGICRNWRPGRAVWFLLEWGGGPEKNI